MNTIIKLSVKNLHAIESDLIKLIYNITSANFDLEKYSACYKGQLEQGFKITFFDTVPTEKLALLHCTFINQLLDYGCFYIDNEIFSGCIKEYLYNKGCGVKGLWKTGVKNLC
jgi:hypothetical protein